MERLNAKASPVMWNPSAINDRLPEIIPPTISTKRKITVKIKTVKIELDFIDTESISADFFSKNFVC